MKFALSLTARKQTANNIQVQNMAAYIDNATSEYEAVGRGIEMAKKQWPESRGWDSHGCVICLIPEEK